MQEKSRKFRIVMECFGVNKINVVMLQKDLFEVFEVGEEVSSQESVFFFSLNFSTKQSMCFVRFFI